MTEVTIRRALLSVSDKSGVVELASRLAKGGVELVSTGGTARALRDAGLQVRDVADVTGFPEMMDGRVKTLHPRVHGGLLAVRDDPEHAAAMEAHEIGAIDLLVSNLYPFEETVRRGAGRDEIIENIDIGGPAMIRSAAKNHAYVTIVTDAADYPDLLAELAGNDGATTLEFRKRMAAKAFSATAAYDSMISQWFAFADQQRLFPEMLAVNGRLVGELRYGENPHQRAALYAPLGPHAKGLGQGEQVQGKELSYNNFADADAALELVAEFAGQAPTAVIVKHGNPCGAAQAGTLEEAYRAALACDAVSAFGGIIAVNRPLDGATAAAITEIFTEVVVAPGADEGARAAFAAKPNLRLLLVDDLPDSRRSELLIKPITGALLVQTRDNGTVTATDLKVVTELQPSERQLSDMLFAWTVARHVKSNAIVFARDGVTAGIGAGQMNRRDSARIAVMRAREAAEAAGWNHARTIGGAMASDAFLPFADGLDVAIEAGVTAVIQPGGAMRDDEVIARANEAGIAMVFTGMRHFRH
jgi:phosphoribosylaminoimidazolecarboxamide formyltransferase/IMP cyclohydrolase